MAASRGAWALPRRHPLPPAGPLRWPPPPARLPLAAAGLAEDTVIVYTSDHGELAGAHGLFGKGPCAYDENLRLPLIVVDPDRPGGQRTEAMASQIDLVPTMVGLATGEPPPPSVGSLPGVDLTPVLANPSSAGPRDSALFMFDGLLFVDGRWMIERRQGRASGGRDLSKRGFMRTLITPSHKFTRYFAPTDHHVPQSIEELRERNTLELFDLAADPHEQHNRAAGSPDLAEVEDLAHRLSERFAAEVGDDDGHWLPDESVLAGGGASTRSG